MLGETPFNCSVYTQHLQDLTHPVWLGRSHISHSAPSYTVGMDTDDDLGLYDPSAVWGPVVACQTQEIPLLLLHSSVVATCLCVYFGGAVPVSVCQSWSPFFGQGAYSNAGLPGPQSQRTHTRTVKQTQQRLVSQDTLNFYWSPNWQPFFISSVPSPPPTPLLKP